MRRFCSLALLCSAMVSGLLTTAIAAGKSNDAGIALKSGETIELNNLFWVARCHSLLNGPMVAEALEAPPGVTVAVKPQNIVPHMAGCAKPVPGGVLTVSAAKDIKTRVAGHLTIRVKYPTVDGERQKAFTFEAVVVP